MRHGRRLLALGVAASLALVGCGSSSSTASPAATSGPSVPASAPASAAASAAGSEATSAAPASAKKMIPKLSIDNESGSAWNCQFNPLNTSDSWYSVGYLYEPLFYVNSLQSNPDGSPKTTPWLATAYTWNTDETQVSFAIRQGVTWSDGQAFTADDVVYTFNALKNDPGADVQGLWTSGSAKLTTVAKDASDPTKVVFTFDKPAGTMFFYLADQQPIVPQHIFGASGVDQTKLETLPNTTPVGTGPLTMSQCEGTNMKFLRNKTYWQSTPDNIVPKVEEVDYPAYLSNDSANQVLHDGGAQWGGQFIQNIQAYYLDVSPEHHIWQPATGNVMMYLNIAKDPLLAQVAVRQALSFAINRNDASQLGEGGQELPSNQTGIVLPTFKGWYDASIDTTVAAGDPAKADQVLEAAGFTKGSDGIYADSKGTKLSFTIKSVQGYSDWDAAIQTIIASAKKAGIELKQQDEDAGTLSADLASGNFQIGYNSANGGPTPFYELRNDMDSGSFTNYGKYKNPTADSLISQYLKSTSIDEQKSIVKQLGKIMNDEVPVIPVTESADWFQYDTTAIDGWPTADNPYCQPAPWNVPDNMVLLTTIWGK
jgi:peptide/nickel transport system substrate-binding protein